MTVLGSAAVPSAAADPRPDRPSIWVGSEIDSEVGILFGAWVDAARASNAVRADIARLLAYSPTAARSHPRAERFGIFDSDGFWPARVNPGDPIDQVCRLARQIVRHGQAYAAWVSLERRPPEDHTTERFEAAYLGQFVSLADYVDQFVHEMGYQALLDKAVPAGIRPYVTVDVDALANDLERTGEIAVVHDPHHGRVWLFEVAP